jgi:peroxiredoxin
VARGIQAGDKAPDFTLPSQTGEQVRLQDRLGERVVALYFYPKDNTSGCTAEARAFRDSHETFTEAGADVIGSARTRRTGTAASPASTGCRSRCWLTRAAGSARPTGCPP